MEPEAAPREVITLYEELLDVDFVPDVDGHDMSDKVQDLNHRLEEIYEFLKKLKPEFEDHNAQENVSPEQILEELQEAHALAAPFHSNFVVHGNDIVIHQEKLKQEHGKAGKTVDEAYENTAGESNVDRAIDVGKFLLDKITRYINRLEAFKHRPNSEEAEESLHGKHNPLSEMPFAGEEMLSSEKGHKRDRNALSEMPFAGETSLSSEHHHKRNRNALTEMPFAGEESLSSENVHKRNRNSLTEMPFANEESLSTEVSGKIRKNRHGKRKQSSSSSSSSSSEEHGGKKKRGRSEHMDPGKYLKTVTSISHLAHALGRAVKISPDGQVIVNKRMLQGNDEDSRKLQKMLRQSLRMPDMRGDRREVKKATDYFLKKIMDLMGETRSRMFNMVGPKGKHADRNTEHDINLAVKNMGYAQEQMEKILRGLKSVKSLRRSANKNKKHSDQMQLFRERRPY
ncbi:hypothetical protein DdX_22254 [Ditylenchus destructor]|uniref:Uncharacterized protein n=1 Tax=Ditylenchus destructor TaxID=166010 RepID=A0AAD4MEB9_9BILA|nr:hypothetical protein DdX_22254 [Ditylenchus destructor]